MSDSERGHFVFSTPVRANGRIFVDFWWNGPDTNLFTKLHQILENSCGVKTTRVFDPAIAISEMAFDHHKVTLMEDAGFHFFSVAENDEPAIEEFAKLLRQAAALA